jgi:Leucine-rich repeat (LRR) protein
MAAPYHHYFHHTFSFFFFTGIFFNSSTLEELDLAGTSLPLNFLQNIEALPALKVLSVSYCDLNGILPAQGKLTTLYPLKILSTLYILTISR